MVSAVMVVEESDSFLPTSDRSSLDLGGSTVKDIQLKEQSTAGDDIAPKARKPYTITKQRERWTEEEHKKFLDALKLYGRAWRRIEEHVGTKTAVQIRSHAQKFFSKVARETNTGDASSVKPVEIPPPRPKRKPMHPYPRKLVSPVKTGILIPEKPAMPASPNTFGQENLSPTSVLSAVRSDSSGVAESSMPDDSPSSVSSALNDVKAFGSEVFKLSSEDVVSSRLDREDENSSTDEEIPLELDLSYQKTGLVKGDSNESATQSLKLFGKTLFVENPHGSSCSFPVRVTPLKIPTCDALYTRITIEKLNPMDACSPTAFPWLSLCSNESGSAPEVLSPTPIKAQSSYTKKEKSDNDEQNEGSSTGSNTELENANSPISLKRKGSGEKSFSSYKLSKRISTQSSNCRSGFVPYKRCFAKQDSAVSSMEAGEEREKQRIRLCL